jgi:hypothetical protein
MLKIKGLQIDGLRDALRVGEGRSDETGTLPAEPSLETTASVTICQVRNKGPRLNGLRADVRVSLTSRDLLRIPRLGRVLTGTLFRRITVCQSFLDCPPEFLFCRAIANLSLFLFQDADPFWFPSL